MGVCVCVSAICSLGFKSVSVLLFTLLLSCDMLWDRTTKFVCLLMYFSHMWARSQVSEDILVCVCHFKLPAMSASELIAETVTIL